MNQGSEKCNVTLRKPSASLVTMKSEHIDKILIAIHFASNKHQRNAVPHYTKRKHGDLLNIDFQKSSDSSSRIVLCNVFTPTRKVLDFKHAWQ